MLCKEGAVGENSGTGSMTGWNYLDEVRADRCCVGAELLSRADTLLLVPQTNSDTCFSVNKDLDEWRCFHHLCDCSEMNLCRLIGFAWES